MQQRQFQKALFLIAVLEAFSAASCFSQARDRTDEVNVASPLTLEITPSLAVPIGNSASYFGVGTGASVSLRYRLPKSVISLFSSLDYYYTPEKAARTLSLGALHAGAGVDVPIGTLATFSTDASAGYWLGALNDLSVGSSDPYLSGGVAVRFHASPMVTINTGARYVNYLGLYQGIGAEFGIGLSLGNLGGTLSAGPTDLSPAFPVFYKYYDDHPIGTIDLSSHLKVPATNISVSVYVKQFMDGPKVSAVPGSLQPGKSESVSLYALFSDRVLDITEDTKVAAQIAVDYTVAGKSYEDESFQTLTLHGRNAMTWDDTRKAAAYVTTNDPEVVAFARGVTSYVRATDRRYLNTATQAAAALHDALDLYGLNYAPNPATPYSEVSKEKDVIDFLQFPRETFQYKAGDCSDISILYSALLQAVGVDTAFVTIPGHIFVAFDTGIPSAQAASALIPERQYIDHGGHVWIPVEITLRGQGFVKAWRLGAQEWNANNALGQAGFFPVEAAWKDFPPVGPPGSEPQLTLPSDAAVFKSYLADVNGWVDSALQPQIDRLKDEIAETGSAAEMNDLGVLYAKYGKQTDAETEFKRAVDTGNYLPAILNLGNLYFLQGDWRGALDAYTQAQKLSPGNPHIMLDIARANDALQRYDVSHAQFAELQKVDPGLASQYAYLGSGAAAGGTRAADAESVQRNVIWED